MGRACGAFNIATCARPNILALKPYRCARDDYQDDGTNVLLDANENAYGPSLSLTDNGSIAHGQVNGHVDGFDPLVDLLGLNRYPDPHQVKLKQALCNLRTSHTHSQKTLTPDNLFVGVGSDEAIDALQRCFCTPGRDKILTCPPTYVMYSVTAQVNDIEVVEAPLDQEKDFGLQPDLIKEKLSVDSEIKQVYICSPGNPTGAVISKSAIQPILEHPTWNGVVVIDEAYIDFSPDGASLAEWVTEWPNLVVLQTLSKAFGLAGIRLGAAFTSPEIAQLLNNLKAPYNVSSPTSQLATMAVSVSHRKVMQSNREHILRQRQRMIHELPLIKGIGRFKGGFDANFLLVEILDRPDSKGKPCNETAMKLYEGLAEKKGVVVRFRGKDLGCQGCLRITVGTKSEVDRLLKEIKVFLRRIYSEKACDWNGRASEEIKEEEASSIVA